MRSVMITRDFYRINPRFEHPEKHSRLYGGACVFFVYLVPVLHVWRMNEPRFDAAFLGALSKICWHAGCEAGDDDLDHRDLEQALWRWATTSDRDLYADRTIDESRAALVASVSRRLRRRYWWRLLCGFVPVIGALVGYADRGSEAVRFDRMAREYFRRKFKRGVCNIEA